MPPLAYVAANAEGVLEGAANGSIVLGFNLSLGFGCGLTAGSGEHGKGEDVLLFCAAVFVFIWAPDDIFRTLLPR